MTEPFRTVICADSMVWLNSQKDLDCVITCMPDMNEIDLKESAYIKWIQEATEKVLKATKDSGYIIFIQTDRKYKGWIDKSYYITDVALKLNYRMLYHKIALRQEVGKCGMIRPTYSHILCYSKNAKVGKLFADVIAPSNTTWKYSIGQYALEIIMDYVKSRGIKTIVDPFVGSGAFIAVANKFGLNAIGVDIDSEQCEKAKKCIL